jgi:hypothetical protein
MAELFASGRLVDVVLALVALEGLALVVLHRATGRGPRPADLLANLLSGAFLLLALRSALVGAWWGWTALCLAAALLAHAADLLPRLRRHPGRDPGI